MNNISLYSFDVFDTVLVRTLSDRYTIFYLMGKTLPQELKHLSADAFMRLRIKAVRNARAKLISPAEEVNLKNIYDEFILLTECPAQLISSLIVNELAIEEKYIQAVPGAKIRVGAARAQCGYCCFISDMYVPHDWLKSILKREGLFEPGDKLYCSSEVGVQKISGNLYKYVCEQEGISLSALHHTGNCLASDVKMPKALGASATLYEQALLSEEERFWHRMSRGDELPHGASFLIGQSHYLRLRYEEKGGGDALVKFYLSTAFPLHFSYVLWVIKESRRLGLTDLYFNARDAWLSYQIFNTLKSLGHADGIEAHYLFGSRKTWMPFLLSGDLLDEEHWYTVMMCLGGHKWTPENILEILGLNDDASKAALCKDLVWSQEELKQWRSYHQYGEFRKSISKEPYATRSRQDILKRQTDVLGYLKQEGLFEQGRRSGLVDTGWSGRWHGSLTRAIKDESGNEVHILFMGRRNSKYPDLSYKIHTYLFDEVLGKGPPVNTYFNRFVEMCCPCPHGMTTGYRYVHDRWQPVLTDVSEKKQVQALALEPLIKDYVEGLGPSVQILEEELDDIKNCIFRIVKRWWFHPPDCAHKLLTFMSFNSSPDDDFDEEFDRELSLKNLIHLLKKEPYGEKRGVWIQAHLQKMTRLKKSLYKLLRFLKNKRSR